MNVDSAPSINAISLFSGVAGLDLGIRLAIPEARTVCYVEVEAYAAAVLAARMESGDLDAAPVWSDIGTFDAREWRGCVDLVVGGIPCTPYSLAGEQKGDEDERALWPEFARVVAECRPSLVFIENVPAFVMGGGFRPLGEELCRLGYELEDPLFLSAADVGAPHIRERVFILAHSERAERWPIVRGQLNREGSGGRKTTSRTPHASGALADTEGLDRKKCLTKRRPEGRVASGRTSREVADGERPGLEGRESLGRDDGEEFQTTERGGGPAADAGQPRFRVTRLSRVPGKRFRTSLWDDAHRRNQELRGARLMGRQPVPDSKRDGLRERAERGGSGACETVTWHAEPFPVGLFPPGPKDFDEWARVLEVAPWLAPSVKSGVRLRSDELAMVLDENRAHQLRATGNGVVPVQAAQALSILLEWAGLR